MMKIDNHITFDTMYVCQIFWPYSLQNKASQFCNKVYAWYNLADLIS